MRRFLLIPRLRVLNANAMSSPYTTGFPAMTAWLGFMHALQRRLQQTGLPYGFSALAVSCHELDMQTYKGRGDYVYSVIGTGNPLDKHGNRQPFIEAVRCHLDVSLLLEIAVPGDKQHDRPDEKTFPEAVQALLPLMKCAGGDILDADACKILTFDDDDPLDTELPPLLRALMPGYIPIERRVLLQAETDRHPDGDVLDALLGCLKIEHRYQENDNGKGEWTAARRHGGWLVPLAVGFQGISPIAAAENTRDADTPHRFAESIITLGEFVMPLRITSPDEMLWQYGYEPENNLYVCRTRCPASETL